ncbi:MAG: hypothetical protein K0S61_84 [Anaerocolumna sp.]|jgi:hypothetical protein|nr:hypothetical protein [Anaerocolumna sp.]
MKKKCENCIWHYSCGCDLCTEDGLVVCSINNEHVSKNDSCERYAEEDK